MELLFLKKPRQGLDNDYNIPAKYVQRGQGVVKYRTMRRSILIVVIVIGAGLAAAAGYYLITNALRTAPEVAVVKRGGCAIEVDVPSVTWPSGYDARVRDLVNGEIEKTIAGLLDRHQPGGAPSHARITEAQNALAEWCKKEYAGAGPYSVDINAAVTYNAGGLLSMSVVDNFKTGGSLRGARGAGLVFNAANGKKLSLADLVRTGKMSAFAAVEHQRILETGGPYLDRSVKEEIERFLTGPTESTAVAWYKKHGYATVSSDAIAVSYNPGDIGRSVGESGILEIKIPRSDLAGILR